MKAEKYFHLINKYFVFAVFFTISNGFKLYATEFFRIYADVPYD